jgi:phosphoribosylamine--glycine ligase
MDDVEGLLGLCRQHEIHLVVVGPEAPLVAGIADELRRAGVAVFGPSKAAARIEGSKAFAKEVLESAAVPTAAALDEARAPCVVKADGLAAGKGVFVCRAQEEADAALVRARALGGDVVVEELLEGDEVSLFALSDGQKVLPLAPAQDFKRLEDGDEGPNTGGMGSYSPVPMLGEDDVEELVGLVHRPVIAELERRGTPFAGLLYAGLMLTDAGPRVLEFNCRFGDPETQALLPRLGGDILEALAAAAHGDLAGVELDPEPLAAVAVVLAAPGYPDEPQSGVPIGGVEVAAATGALIFHAGTALRHGQLVSAGGRVLDVVGTGDTVSEAREQAYAAVEQIDFPGAQFRSDIAAKAVHVAG